MTKKPISRDQVAQSWIGVIVTSILFGVIWQWLWFIPIFALVGAISTTLTYFTQEKIRCPYCRAELTSQSKICPQCGVEILSECPNCHKTVQWGARFCDSCGVNLSDLASKSKQNASTEPVAPPAPTVPRAVFCPTCGEPVNEGAKFCYRCGTEIPK